jgi:hypothetical protein
VKFVEMKFYSSPPATYEPQSGRFRTFLHPGIHLCDFLLMARRIPDHFINCMIAMVPQYLAIILCNTSLPHSSLMLCHTRRIQVQIIWKIIEHGLEHHEENVPKCS